MVVVESSVQQLYHFTSGLCIKQLVSVLNLHLYICHTDIALLHMPSIAMLKHAQKSVGHHTVRHQYRRTVTHACCSQSRTGGTPGAHP